VEEVSRSGERDSMAGWEFFRILSKLRRGIWRRRIKRLMSEKVKSSFLRIHHLAMRKSSIAPGKLTKREHKTLLKSKNA
jgi:hypothetical protein